MKCPICNTENTSDAQSCERCGFSLSLAQQAVWPELPRVEFPEPLKMPVWPEMSASDAVPAPPAFPHVAGETEREEVLEAPAAVVEEPAPQRRLSVDQVAREHLNRAFSALKEGRLDQAEWEFEQASKTALDEDIIRMAQSQLEALREKMVKSAILERQRPVRKPVPVVTPRALVGADALKSSLRVGLYAGLVAGFIVAITGSAALCLGFLLGPAAGFIAGWLASGPAKRQEDIVLALIAGGVAGLGAAVGQWIGYPPSISSYPDAESLRALSCFMGFAYIVLAAIAGAVGWGTKNPRM